MSIVFLLSTFLLSQGGLTYTSVQVMPNMSTCEKAKELLYSEAQPREETFTKVTQFEVHAPIKAKCVMK